jgi:methionyl-tRNA synthetase
MNDQDLNAYIKKVVEFSFDANKYFNDSQPWALKKTDPDKMNTILFTIINQIKNISILLHPIMPIATAKVLNVLNIEKNCINLKNIIEVNPFDHNKLLKKTNILFNKIEDDN